MRSCYPLLLMCLLSVQIVKGQGTVLFTWHGDSNFFHASFEVTAAEMQPGAIWSSELFSNSITIDSRSGVTYHADNPSDYIAGGTYSNGAGSYFSMALFDFNHGMEVLV